MALCSAIVLRCTVSDMQAGSHEIKTAVLRSLSRCLSYLTLATTLCFVFVHLESPSPSATDLLHFHTLIHLWSSRPRNVIGHSNSYDLILRN